MTRSLDAPNYAALQARNLVARDFIWFVVRNRSDGSPVNDGYWSDVGPITCNVVDPDTGGTQSRSFIGADGLISISDIPLVSALTVQTVTVTLSQVSDRINTLVRTYDCKQGTVQIFRGLFDTATRTMVGPAYPRFAGFIDQAPITTPVEGGAGNVTLTCTSNTQELTRANSDTRSDASQRLRAAADNFYQDVAVVGTWQLYWGKATGVLGASTAASPAAQISGAFKGDGFMGVF